MNQTTMNKTAIIIGATGLVGKELLQQLSALYQKIIVIARRPPQIMTGNMRFYQLTDFANIASTFDNLRLDGQTDAFSCLGTTKKQAGSKEQFYKVDYEYNLAFAQACYDKGVETFFLVSAMGADSNSRFFYNQVKGKLEQAVTKIGFAHLYIFRPSLLIGEHKGRPLEKLSQGVFKLVSPLVSEKLPAHPITAKRVAIAMTMTAYQRYTDSQFHDELERAEQQVEYIENKTMLEMTRI